MSIEIQPYFVEGERYPALIGVRAEGDEYETAYVSKSELVDALAENVKLRKELEQWHRLTAGIELPEYPVTEFHPKNLERENAKLRELVADLHECIGEAECKRCHEWYGTCELEQRMRELGIEVGG